MPVTMGAEKDVPELSLVFLGFRSHRSAHFFPGAADNGLGQCLQSVHYVGELLKVSSNAPTNKNMAAKFSSSTSILNNWLSNTAFALGSGLRNPNWLIKTLLLPAAFTIMPPVALKRSIAAFVLFPTLSADDVLMIETPCPRRSSISSQTPRLLLVQ